MTRTKVSALTLLTLVAFAANSLLCRSALTGTNIDAASFTTIRITSGALLLYLILKIKGKSVVGKGTWLSALVLVFFAAGFSFAYMNLTVALPPAFQRCSDYNDQPRSVVRRTVNEAAIYRSHTRYWRACLPFAPGALDPAIGGLPVYDRCGNLMGRVFATRQKNSRCGRHDSRQFHACRPDRDSVKCIEFPCRCF